MRLINIYIAKKRSFLELLLPVVLNLSIYIKTIVFILIILSIFSCKKLVQIDAPSDKIIGTDIYENPSTAAGVLTGIYYSMSGASSITGGSSISVLAGLSSDELKLFNLNADEYKTRFYQNNLSASFLAPGFWAEFYTYIYKANEAIEGLEKTTILNKSIKQQLVGEAQFIRAFCYFYLVNLYGNVPLITTTDYTVTGTAPREEKKKIYFQIISDLINAQANLSEEYLSADVKSSTSERIRPNKSTATALLSRVYLFTENWQLAEQEASEILNDSRFELMTDLNEVFLKNSKETIWQLQPVSGFANTQDGAFFIPEPGTAPAVYLSGSVYLNFEINDLRKSSWIKEFNLDSITYAYPYKYKIKANPDLKEYLTVFRLAEQFLIRAEARARQNKLSDALSDINMVRNRAGLEALSTINQQSLLEKIFEERRLEFFSEWGHRWLDLKRNNSVDEVMKIITPLKGGSWETYKQLYPIPQLDIERDPSLYGNQNPGY